MSSTVLDCKSSIKYGTGRVEVYITPTLGSVVRPPPLRTRC